MERKDHQTNVYGRTLQFWKPSFFKSPELWQSKTILVGYDSSALSEKAIDLALELASPFGADVLVVSVARPPEPSISIELHAVLDEAKQHYEEKFREIRSRAEKSGVSLRTEVLVGPYCIPSSES